MSLQSSGHHLYEPLLGIVLFKMRDDGGLVHHTGRSACSGLVRSAPAFQPNGGQKICGTALAPSTKEISAALRCGGSKAASARVEEHDTE
jgi:hypothetical protein